MGKTGKKKTRAGKLPGQKNKSKLLRPDPGRRRIIKTLAVLGLGTAAAGGAYWHYQNNRGPSLPKIKLHFVFSQHETARDAEYLFEVCRKNGAKALFEENAFASDRDAHQFDNGRRYNYLKAKNLNFGKLEDFLNEILEAQRKNSSGNQFAKRLELMLVANKIPNICLESLNPELSRDGEKISELEDEHFNNAIDCFKTGNFRKALENMRRNRELRFQGDNIREAAIIKDINEGNIVKRLLEQYPELRGEKEIPIAIQLGGRHAHIVDYINQPAYSHHQHFPFSTEFLFNSSTLPEQKKDHQARKLDESTLAKIIFSEFLAKKIGSKISGHHLTIPYAQVLASQFSTEEIRRFSEKGATDAALHQMLKTKHPAGVNASPEQITAYVSNYLKKLGIKAELGS